ncbi:MAG: TetR/AcrR family transcriptional regulator [Lentisphaeria bacterium]|nr:TetR/AcrR family transcriptional regulator [Lentisphaeria bacterium]
MNYESQFFFLWSGAMTRAAKTNTDIRQEQIASAALELIGAGGLSGLSIAAIAERVGIVPSAVYRHYPGKEAVLDAVLELLRVRMLANAEAVRTETPDAVERLRLLLIRHMTMLVDNPAFPHVIFAHFSHDDDENRRSVLQDTMRAYLDEVTRIIEQGQAAGAIRGDIPPRTAAVMFIGLILPAAMLHRLSRGGFDAAGHVNAAWPVFLGGIVKS